VPASEQRHAHDYFLSSPEKVKTLLPRRGQIATIGRGCKLAQSVESRRRRPTPSVLPPGSSSTWTAFESCRRTQWKEEALLLVGEGSLLRRGWSRRDNVEVEKVQCASSHHTAREKWRTEACSCGSRDATGWRKRPCAITSRVGVAHTTASSREEECVTARGVET
jgi:hypothetical protein